MSLLNRVKSVLGINGSASSHQNDPVSVTVEQGPHDDIDQEPESTETTETTSEPVPEPGSSETTEPDSAVADDPAPEPVTDISGIGPAYAEKLAAAGIQTVGDLRNADLATVVEDSGVSEGRISSWIEAARER